MMKMDPLIADLLAQNNIPIIDADTNYWFVRSNGGEYFERFFFDDCIAIEWDEISNIDQLMEMDYEDIREEIIKLYPDEKRPGLVATYFIRFLKEMKIGDIVLVPTENSERIAFGRITSDPYKYTPTDDEILDIQGVSKSPILIKRRDVEWFHNIPMKRSQIDPNLVSVIYAHNTIVDANPYKFFINRTLYNIYYMDGKLHATFNINKPDDVYALDFLNFINTIVDTAILCGKALGEEFDKKDLTLRSSINSPGPVEFIAGSVAFMIAISGVALFINGSKTKIRFNLFGVGDGEIDIESDGLLEKIRQLKEFESTKKNQQQLEQIETNLLEAKNELNITSKSN